MTQAILQLNREKTIFWLLLGILFSCVSFYMYFINTTIHNVVVRQNLELEASKLTFSIGREEFQYITMRNKVTLPLAYSLGFKDIKNKTFISRNSNLIGIGQTPTNQVSYLTR